MLHIEPVKKKRKIPGIAVSACVLAAALAALVFGVRSVADRTEDEQLAILENAIRRACVQCYAIEGRYPPDLDYLEENYGLILDREHYVYHYRLEGSNLMPEIQVFEEK